MNFGRASLFCDLLLLQDFILGPVANGPKYVMWDLNASQKSIYSLIFFLENTYALEWSKNVRFLWSQINFTLSLSTTNVWLIITEEPHLHIE